MRLKDKAERHLRHLEVLGVIGSVVSGQVVAEVGQDLLGPSSVDDVPLKHSPEKFDGAPDSD